MKKLIIAAMLFCSLFLASGASIAASTKQGPACISKDLYDQLTTALVQKDEQAWTYLMKNGCIITRPGIRITVLNRGGFLNGVAKVRAYVGDGGIILYMHRDNIKGR